MQIPAPGAHQCVIGVAIALPSHYAAQVREVREAAGRPPARRDPPPANPPASTTPAI